MPDPQEKFPNEDSGIDDMSPLRPKPFVALDTPIDVHNKFQEFLKTPTRSTRSPDHPVKILQEAMETLGQRGTDYDDGTDDDGERSMERIVTAFNAMTNQNLTETEGWLFMVALKCVRGARSGKRDSFVDGAAYFGLAGESAAKENQSGE